MNPVTTWVPRLSHARAAPATSSRIPTERLRATAIRCVELDGFPTAMTCMPRIVDTRGRVTHGSIRLPGHRRGSGGLGPTALDPTRPHRPPVRSSTGTPRSLPAEDPSTIAARPTDPDAPAMSLARPADGSSRSVTRPIIGASLLALLLALLTVVPTSAANEVVTLSNASVSTTTGTTSTTITFSVTYRDTRSFAPAYVRVRIAGMTKQLFNTDGRQGWKKGVRFSGSTALPAGTWTPQFDAADSRGHTATAAGSPLPIPPPRPRRRSRPPNRRPNRHQRRRRSPHPTRRRGRPPPRRRVPPPGRPPPRRRVSSRTRVRTPRPGPSAPRRGQPPGRTR